MKYGGYERDDKTNLLDSFLNQNPQKRVLIQEIILIGTGICGRFLGWYDIPFSPVSNIAGIVLIIGAFMLHGYSQKTLAQAHVGQRKSAVLLPGVSIQKSGILFI